MGNEIFVYSNKHFMREITTKTPFPVTTYVSSVMRNKNIVKRASSSLRYVK